jgi:hypothetical protein
MYENVHNQVITLPACPSLYARTSFALGILTGEQIGKNSISPKVASLGDSSALWRLHH